MKTKTLTTLASAALLAFASCTDEAQEMESLQSEFLKQIVMTTEDFQPEAGSRTLYQIADGAVTCTWAENDTVGVFPSEGAQAYFPMASGAGTKNATFDGKGWALKDGYTYGAYYPFIADILLDRNAVSVSYIGQKQVGNGSMEHLGAYDYMVAVPVAPEFGSANFKFKHLSALVQLRLSIPQPTTLSSVKLVTESKAFALEGTVDIMADKPNITSATSAKEIELTLQEVSTTKENQVVTLYMMLPPVDLSTKTLKAIITSDKGTQKIELVGKNFQASTAYGLSVEMESTDASYKDGVVSLAEAGTLKQLLGEDFLNITKLKIVGPINGDDVRCLHQMLGSNAFAEKGKLTSLDLSKASIVKGGSWYCKLNEDMLEYKYCYTSDNVISEYMFYNFTNLQNLVLPNNITDIRYNAFKGSSSLTSLIIPDGVTSIGRGAFSGCSSLTSLNIPAGVTSIGDHAFNNCSSLRSIHIPDGVTSIGEGTFYDCSSLESIILGKDITFIGNGAFNGCSSLESIHIPNGVMSIGDHAFNDCTSLTSVRIPDGVTSINERTFYGCASLVSITLGEGITSIGSDAFSGCSSLEGIQMPDGVKSIGDWAFYGCFSLKSINIPNGVTSIEEQTFRDCSSLESIAIPDGLTSIGQSAFYNCSSLGSIDIPDGVTSIGGSTFSGCSSLTSIHIPDGITSIGGSTFSGCSSLTSITIGNGVTAIGYKAFENCSSLTSVHITDLSAWCKIVFDEVYSNPLYNGAKLYLNNQELTELIVPEGITEIKDYAFYNCESIIQVTIGNEVSSIGSSAFYGCSSLESINIPDGVTSIGSSAFRGCSSLTSATIGNGVTSIGSSAFYGCSSLESINIPDGVTFIGGYAFYGCSSLESINIPDSVTSIGDYAFQGCSYLTSATIGNGVTSIGSSAFYGCSSLVSVSMGQNITSINYRAFQGCSYLISIDIPDNVTFIGGYAFHGCSSLESINIPDGVTSIGDYAFSGCYSLTSVHITDLSSWCKITFSRYESNPIYYGAKLYLNNQELTELIVPEGITEIKDYAFYNCESIIQVTIGNGVTSIGDGAFNGCSSLTSATIGNGVTSIGSSAFYGCSSLTSVHITDLSTWCKITFSSYNSNPLYDGAKFYLDNKELTEIVIPAGIKRIKDYAFYGYTSLTKLTINDNVNHIGIEAFKSCKSLAQVYCHATTPPAINTTAYDSSFDATGSKTLHVPAGCSTKYNTSNWKNCFANIVEMK